MKNKIVFALFFVLSFSFYHNVFASEICSPSGYTVLTINGIFTKLDGAIYNKDVLKYKLGDFYNNQPLKVDFLYNPTHLAGAGDVTDAIAQGVFNQKSDYDLVEMINDASRKVTTQKTLLVAHSQGNFYANNFYDKLASQPGGVPGESIGVYGVGSPADRVAGGGKYITSDTDSVIAGTVAKFIKILPPNAHINLQPADGNGHAFAEVYLKYQGNRIISEIKSALDKLHENDEQLPADPCISPPELTALHKVEGALLASADYTIDKTKTAAVYIANGSYDLGGYIGTGIRRATLTIGGALNNLFANAVDALDDPKSISTLPPDLPAGNTPSAETPNEIIPPEPVPAETASEPASNQEPMPNTEAGVLPEIIVENIEEPKPEEVKTAELEPEKKNAEENPYPNLLPGGGGVAASAIPEENKNQEQKNDKPAAEPDITPPVITILGDNPTSLEKGSVYTDAGATAVDDVDQNIQIVATGVAEVNTAAAGTYTITYTAVDSAGNISTAARTVNVTEPAPPPPPPPIVLDEGAKLYRPNFATVSGNYAYVLSGPNDNALEVIDVSNPANLTHKKYLLYDMDGPALYDPKSMAISGNYAYVASYGNALEVIDITDPINPAHFGVLKNGTDGAALNHPSSIAISGNYAYVVSFSGSSLEIIDISDPAHPAHKGNLYGNNSYMYHPNAVAISGNYAFIVSEQSNELSVVDISDPAHPILASMLSDGTGGVALSYPTSIYISGGNAFISSRGSRALEIVDISNPLAPAHKAKLSDGFGNPDNFTPNFVTISGNYAYITSWAGETLEIVDIRDPSAPAHKGSVANGSYGAILSSPSSVFVSGNYAYVSSYTGSALEAVDISNPAFPIHKNKILSGEQSHSDPPVVLPSSEKQITGFSFNSLSPAVSGTIDETLHTIALTVPFDTNISALAPAINISDKSSVNPASGTAQDFSNPVVYTVTAEDGSTQNYTATVNVAADSNIVPDNGVLSITGYTFNGNAGDLAINPLTNPVNILITASKNVNWMSVKIESLDNSGVYKMYQSGAGCADGTNTCSKTWNGALTRGGLLQNGVFRLKVHIKDLENNEFYDYLTPYMINAVIP